jgi:hypothetical protein
MRWMLVGGGVNRMKKSRHEPECMLAHELIDNLANLIGHCDLLSDEMEAGPSFAKRVGIIQNAARRLVTDLIEHQHELSEGPPTSVGPEDKIATLCPTRA